MEEDPAVTKARQLLQERQIKPAFQILVKRINELNTLLVARQTTGVVPKKKPKHDPFMKRLVRAGIIVTAGIIVIMLLLISSVAENDEKLTTTEYSTALASELMAYCDMEIQHTAGSDVCLEWSKHIASESERDATICLTNYDPVLDHTDFGSCLQSRGIQLPEK